MIPSSAGASQLPAVSPANEPAFVREGSNAVKRAYAEALGFEEMLVSQLAQSLARTGGLGGESEGASGEAGMEAEGQAGGLGGSSVAAGGGLISSMLPQTLAEAVAKGGGLGLASQIATQVAGEGGAAAGGGSIS